MSGCHGSRYTQAAPLRRPPWFTAATEASSVRSHGTMPLDCPLVPRISAPRDRILDQPMPIPPENLLSRATWAYRA
jgi:hypothetical protein